MIQIGIWDRGGELETIIGQYIATIGAEPPHQTAGRHPAAFSGQELDLLTIAPGVIGWAGADSIQSRTVLLPGSAGPLARTLQGRAAVSYGASPKDTLTFSSLEGAQVCLALQRELVTVVGKVLERQELVLPFPQGRPPLLWLAAIGTLLLLDVTPKQLENGLRKVGGARFL